MRITYRPRRATWALFAVVVLVTAGVQLRRHLQIDVMDRPSSFPKSHASSPAIRSPGCGTGARSPEGEVRSVDGRDVLVWGPPGYDPSRAWPVVLVFHGLHSNAKTFASWFAMEQSVGGEAFTVYPSAKDGAWDVRGATDLDFVDAVMESISASYCVDRGRVLAFGFSYGGKLAYHLGCGRPDRVHAVAVGDGSMGMRETGCGQIPLLAMHRTVDQDELFAWGTDAFVLWSTESGCTSEFDLVDAVHGCKTSRGCRASATFCEDTYANASWPASWDHTVRKEYRGLAWEWFQSLP